MATPSASYVFSKKRKRDDGEDDDDEQDDEKEEDGKETGCFEVIVEKRKAVRALKTKFNNYKRDFGTIRTAADEALNAARASEARASINAEMRDLMDRLALLSTVVDSDLPALQALLAF